MLKKLLFETRMGEVLLSFLEQKLGLAVVSAEWLAGQRSAEPANAAEPR